ncbi:hypothetical protein [Rahnella laticis]|uniref:hypothetical protein n=1 Tax=Rahnella laticis TaxID=2787622 RepID=UPI0018A304B3|nr:hypothetical protein [Rahnella laticis]MBF7995939.1 hypothetical protein [Rahnella laticis]
MKELDELHNKIGQLLVDAGPQNAKKIIALAKLPLDDESCEYQYDYIDEADSKDWFVPDKLASHDLKLLLVKMRNFYIQNNMTNGKPAWTACEITVDIPEEKISINLQYED